MGRTVQQLRARVNEHRAHFYKLISDPTLKPDDTDDGYSLGRHLVEAHNLNRRSDFNTSYNLAILCNSSPKSLDIDEHKYIQKLRTIKPYGLNAVDPFGIPLLDDT